MISSSNKIKDLATVCPVCRRQDISFLPLPDFYRENAQRHGFVYYGKCEMTSHETYTCSSCGASDRERLYAYWLDQQIREGSLDRDIKVIHFAPELALSKKLSESKFFDYKTADIGMSFVDFKVDLMSLMFDDRSFDFFICSHVLEHVESDDRAMLELFRITKCGGRGILMAPICVGLEATLEDPAIVSEEQRWRYFGQNDHVRLYAHDDYVRKIKKTGFSVKQFGISHFGAETFKQLGLKETSILYVVGKP